MPKINQEEYEILKPKLEEEYTHVGKSRGGKLQFLQGYIERDMKREEWSDGWGQTYMRPVNLFKFIQWEDEEPYNIAELIEDYEEAIRINEIFEKSTKIGLKESEETGVKKDIEWLKDILFDENVIRLFPNDIEKLHELINQLDEPEVLSQGWIKDHELLSTEKDADGNVHADRYIHVKDLQNLLVPKQEEVKVPQFIADYLPLVKEDIELEKASYYAVTNNELPKWKREYDWIRENFETFVKAWLAYPNIEVEEEQKYRVMDKNTTLLGRINGMMLNTAQILEYYPEYNPTFELTEQEIKDYDERYFAFAVKVEELEE